MTARPRIIWAIIRLPALVLLLYLLRHPLLNFIEQRFDVFHVTRFAIDLLSTATTRLIVCAGAFVVLLLLVLCLRRVHHVAAYLILLGGVSALVALSYQFAATSPRRGALVVLILAANLVPTEVVGRLKQFPRVSNAVMLAGIGVVEVFLMPHYWLWLRNQTDARSRIAGAIPGLLLTSLAFGFLIRGDKLLPVEQMIRMSDDVRIIERGLSFNWIELDSSGTYLYATGHELPHVRRYDLADLAAPPLISDVSTGGAQGFAYDARANEIYAFNVVTRELLYLDAATLAGRRVVVLPNLSPGDPWVVVDPITDTLTLVSEADQRIGVPFVVMDRSGGRVLDERDLDAGNVLMHPRKPWVYLSFFRRRSQLMLYDLQTKTVTATAPSDPRSERLVFWPAANEVLVSSPMESRVLRFDADHLQPKGHIRAPFGARAIAIDEPRQLLLCGNIATGELILIDLRTEKWLRKYYLGPWLRTIQPHVEHGTAYVSANGALYRVDYAAPLQR